VLSLTERIRMVRPNAGFGADFITGFPTETQEQFQQTLDLVQRAGLTHLHVFPYSEREGTPAAKMPKVPVSVRRERARRLREVGQVCFDALSDACIGKTMQVLVEQSGMGMSENYIRVHFTGEAQPAQIVPVRIIGRDKHGLVGQI
ncbi:MAG: tRNA (N(6)-L-threonylcarbamoyladenosine(37)-C(2))-methylthiotransferase MtaB, partial [Alphaproteobacteria bacterium]